MRNTVQHNKFTTRKHITKYDDVVVGNFSNTFYAPREVTVFLHNKGMLESEMFALVKQGKRIDQIADEMGLFPAKIVERLNIFGIKTHSWHRYHKFEVEVDRLPNKRVKADIQSMTDRQIRYFVRKHGPANPKHYFELMRFIDKAGSFYDTPAEQRYEINQAWRLTALKISGVSNDKAEEIVYEDMR